MEVGKIIKCMYFPNVASMKLWGTFGFIMQFHVSRSRKGPEPAATPQLVKSVVGRADYTSAHPTPPPRDPNSHLNGYVLLSLLALGVWGNPEDVQKQN